MLLRKIKNFLFYLALLTKSKRKVLAYISNWQNSLSDPTGYYLDAFRFFYFFLPRVIIKHKNYFNKKARGFGERALHSMWYLLYNKYNFTNFLEIGVYRGQVISLISLMAKLKNKEIMVHGISPFNDTGDTVSRYVQINYLDDVHKNFEKFLLKPASLTKAFSTNKEAINIVCSHLWDCIYIDGSHDYEIVKKDWALCSSQVKAGGIIVMDDASLYTEYQPPFFGFKGHHGPSKVSNEVPNSNFKEVLRVGHNRVFKKIN